LRVWNSGQGTLTAILDLSSIAAPFQVVTKPGPFELAHDRAKTIAVKFAPNTAGPFAGAIMIASSDPKRPSVSVSIAGDGVPGAVAVPSALEFGHVAVGAGRTLYLPIRNGGLGVLHVHIDQSGLAAPFSLMLGGADFALRYRAIHRLKLRFAP
jgi:hypothetical protein